MIHFRIALLVPPPPYPPMFSISSTIGFYIWLIKMYASTVDTVYLQQSTVYCSHWQLNSPLVRHVEEDTPVN